jgi:tRNA-intron endonuclease
MRGKLLGDKVLVADSEDLYEKSGFGELTEKGVELGLEEALYLVDRGKLTVHSNEKMLTFEKFLDEAQKFAFDIHVRFVVYKDLRDRGLVVRSGIKYGTHFRVYERGVKPKKGVRAPWEHAKYLVHALPEGWQFSIPELTRFVRLAHSVKKKLWIAIVDSEGDITYLQTTRIVP